MTTANEAKTVSALLFLICWGLVAWWLFHLDTVVKEQHYEVEIIAIKSSNFEDATCSPSFNITMRIDNRYKHDLYIRDWQYSVRLDGLPLGRGSFPYDQTAYNMSEMIVTGTTSSVLVGIGKEVHSQISNGKSMKDLELQVGMRFTIIELDGSTSRTWLWCSARLGDHSAPSFCRHRIVY